MPKLIFIFFLTLSCGAVAAAAEDTGQLKAAPPASAGRTAQAAAYKKQGDDYAAKEDLKNAAKAYLAALAIGGFSPEERLKMATGISWSDPAAALGEFRAIVAGNPENMKARTALARALLWTGDNAAALKEIEPALQKNPADREALLVKANSLRAPGELKDSIAIYNKLLEGGEDFDARSGLTQALLAAGDLPAARKCALALKPAHPYQEREVKRILSGLEGAESAVAAQKPAAPEPPPADNLKTLKAALAAASGKEARALAYRKLGDAYAGKEDFKNAGAAYASALSLGKFPAEDSIKMAVTVSWNDPAAAAKEFRSIVSLYPENTKARVALARTLSWSGDNRAALKEIEKVLQEAPGDRDALLVKANALRWRSQPGKAAKIFSGLLEKGEDFDARSGLAYALLAEGDPGSARAVAAALKPQYPYQEREAKALFNALDAYAKPVLDARYSYYHDTDFNSVRRYSMSYGTLFGRFRTSLGLTRVDGSDAALDNRMEIISAGTRAKLSGTVDAGLGVSGNFTRSGGSTGNLGWNASVNKSFPDSSVTLSASDSMLSDTALLIDNRIRAANYTLAANKKLRCGVSLNASYSYRDYSDGNNANDSQVAASYPLFSGNPGITAGYRFRYLAFNRQSGGGYYDPNKYLTHQIFAGLFFEKGRFYGSVNPYAGYQSQRRNAATLNNYYAGSAAALGYKPWRNVALELSGEGGNYALQSATSFRYYQLGLGLTYRP